MSSTMPGITDINGFIQYPVPGVDNDSQGFRDRYNQIQTNINIVKEEISTLITDSAKLNTDNNFGGNKITNANLSGSTVAANIAQDADPITGDTLSIPHSGGSVHVIRVGTSENPLTLSFTNWPAETDDSGSRFAKITLIVNADSGIGGGGRNIVWPNNVKFNYSSAENTITPAGTDPAKIFEVFTYDAGTTLFVNYLGLYE